MSSGVLKDRSASEALSRSEIRATVEDALQATQFIDVHTHLFMPSLGSFGLWGIDNLVTYHYLEAELFRSSSIAPEEYWRLSQTQKADAIWRALFVENAPISEATRGVVAVLEAFGLPTDGPDLKQAREFFAAQKLETHIDRVFDMAGVSKVVMTNDPLDPAESTLWEKAAETAPRFLPALRLDRILEAWAGNWQALAARGYKVDAGVTGSSISEVRRFLADWVRIMRPVYMACSLSDSFQYPEESARAKLLGEAVMPACREAGIPFSLMIGVRRQVNPALRLAGDGSGQADLRALERICQDFPDNRFLVSVLSR